VVQVGVGVDVSVGAPVGTRVGTGGVTEAGGSVAITWTVIEADADGVADGAKEERDAAAVFAAGEAVAVDIGGTEVGVDVGSMSHAPTSPLMISNTIEAWRCLTLIWRLLEALPMFAVTLVAPQPKGLHRPG
jgi:hypothetical protein